MRSKKIRIYSLKSAIYDFKARYPAFWFALFFLIGICSASFPLSITVGVLLILLCPRWTPIIVFFAGLGYSLLLSPPIIPIPSIGSGVFEVKQIKRHQTPFQTLLMYEGTLLGFTNGDKTIHRLPCRYYTRPRKNRPDGNYRYYLSPITLIQTSPHHYILKMERQTKWIPIKKANRLVEWRFESKEKLRKWVRQFYSKKSAKQLITGLITGEQESRLLSFHFGQIGLQHLLVISGFHFALLTLFLMALFKPFLPRKIIALILILLLGAYFYFIGEAPSISRAWIGVLLVLGGMLLGLRSHAINAIGLALLAALIFDPFVVFNIGFQLSFSATLGILFFYTPFEQALQAFLLKRSFDTLKELPILDQWGAILISYLRKVVALNGAVLTFTLPLLLMHFHRFPYLSLIYNLFFPFLFSLLIGLLLIALLFPPLHHLVQAYSLFLINLVSYAPKRFFFFLRLSYFPETLVALFFAFFLLWGIYLKWSNSLVKNWEI